MLLVKRFLTNMLDLREDCLVDVALDSCMIIPEIHYYFYGE